MNATPLVTIVSPCYNQERYVASCARSALAQTYRNWEQVFVDDGSTDETTRIIDSFGDPRIRIIRLPHRGLGSLAATYNAALAESNGSLVAVLEGDDRWPADKLERQVPSFDDPSVVLTWGRAALVDEADRDRGVRSSWSPRPGAARTDTRTLFHRLTRTNVLTPTVTVMVRRSALDLIGGFRQSGSDHFVDLPTWLWVMARHDANATFLNEILGIYRVHDEQTSRRQAAAMAAEHLTVVQAVVEALDDVTLERLEWNERSRRRADSRARLAQAESLLARREFGSALRDFGASLRRAPDARDRLFAVAGLVSAATRVNLIAAALAVRDSLRLSH